MHHDDLLSSLQQSAAIKLLQSQNAPLILSFLVDQVKQKQRSTIRHTEMLYSGTAVSYLRLWCDDAHRFLRRYYDSSSDDPVYELTPDSERAIAWVEDLQKSEFVGTESRFLRIFYLLEEIVIFGKVHVVRRLVQLQK